MDSPQSIGTDRRIAALNVSSRRCAVGRRVAPSSSTGSILDHVEYERRTRTASLVAGPLRIRSASSGQHTCDHKQSLRNIPVNHAVEEFVLNFAFKVMHFALQNDDFWIKMMKFVLKMMDLRGCLIGRRGVCCCKAIIISNAEFNMNSF